MKSRTVRDVLCLLAIVSLALPIFAQDVRVQVSPVIMVPLAEADVYGLGFGGGALLTFDLFGFLAPYASADFIFIGPQSSQLQSSLTLVSAGAGLGLYLYPLPRVKLGLSAGPGIYIGSWQQASGEPIPTGNLNWRAGVEAGFRISPSLTVSASASYIDFRMRQESLFQGLSVSLLADIGLNTRNSEGRVVAQGADSTPVFPTLAGDYLESPFGSLGLRNAESAEIRQVEIWFQADPYTSAPVLCASLRQIQRGASVTVPLTAAFSDQIMGVTETLRLNGTIIVNYELLGERRVATAETSISIMNRNALTWQDERVLAAFASPNDPALLDTTKFLAGVVRSNIQADLDNNLQYALGLFEGFRLSGIAWAADPQTPYAATRANSDSVDYVQFPHQTIAYRSGDSDDLAVLYAAALESVGVPAALIALDDEVLVAFRMSSTTAITRTMFASQENFIFINDEAWVPVKVSLIREGFLRAWSEAVLTLNRAGAEGAPTGFFALADAWGDFPPAGVPGVSAQTRKPAEEQVRTAFNAVVSLVISREVEPRAAAMRNAFGPSGGTARQHNALGILYARYGMYREALAAFQEAAARGERRAAINIGNVAFLLGEFETAVAWYESALQTMPDDVTPLIGLARSYYELDIYDKADEYFRRAAALRPELAERYGYLSARLSGTTARASAAMDRLGDMIWEDE
ncbi:MAG: hypothetical protein A2087_02445 [Spirochaetes bacterium GWD1_61_31]|nr:MAG: hypothetical protein A2Y37_05990 [Spirochaetes bacterium GWB1_60_80]OHD35152.1 MAG: hypothetical protein A2004_08955 [Spirochaetes bacterium GWC1_61_12]OHD36500.1 MAG: hypothetical protein A2087_02445 [Spirochaetes bacterium GWD1_61_31]OHD43094.1 MAG: hypothetical protein A2Y35_01625 [Spirochaetes bacterium GWE1_60_18]OHD59689.1 MAG: hypothetical protein A2Y32_12500 [Spirochaetes bacterium GWF1_60_12]HAP44080.1 hypothetical protein [Spirochaetaceae bacterium]